MQLFELLCPTNEDQKFTYSYSTYTVINYQVFGIIIISDIWNIFFCDLVSHIRTYKYIYT